MTHGRLTVLSLTGGVRKFQSGSSHLLDSQSTIGRHRYDLAQIVDKSICMTQK